MVDKDMGMVMVHTVMALMCMWRYMVMVDKNMVMMKRGMIKDATTMAVMVKIT